jgi:hypothetical protein
MDDLVALEVGDNATGDSHDVIRVRAEVVVPRSRCSPHFVVLQQVRINKHTKLSAVTKGRHAKFGFSNPMRNTSMFLSEAIERTTI